MADISLSNSFGLYSTMSNGLYSGTVGGGSGSGSSSTEAFRNLIINGNFIVDQRLEGSNFAIPTNGNYGGPDRFFFRLNSTTPSTYNIRRVDASDADRSVTGQKFSLRVETTNNVTMGSTGFAGIYHGIEGALTAPLMWGTSNGRSAALSFYIKTNVTGTHWVTMRNNAGTSSYASPFTVSSTDTYTRITKSIPSPPANTAWVTDSNVGVYLLFDTVSTTQQSTANDTWLSASYTSPAGTHASNMWTISNNYVELSGIQLEVGSSPSAFEYRPFTLEKKLCQRYYEKSFPEGIAPGSIVPFSAPGYAVYMQGNTSANQIPFDATKRALPTMTFFNPFSSNGNAATDTVYSSNLVTHAPNINKFGVRSTEANLWNKNVYFNWTANADYF